MGLDRFTEDDEEDESEDAQETDEQEEKLSTKKHIANNIKDRVWNSNLDIDINDGRVKADIDDLALVFALMTMDFSESEFQSLVTDDQN